DEHVLAGLGGLDGPFGMAGMRGRDVDGVDLRIVEQGLVAVDDAGAREGVAEPGLIGIARRDRDQLAGPRMLHAIAECLGDAAGANDAPTEFAIGRHVVAPSPALGALAVPAAE